MATNMAVGCRDRDDAKQAEFIETGSQEAHKRRQAKILAGSAPGLD